MMIMDYELIRARYAIEKVLQPDGYYVMTSESIHPIAGRAFHIEVQMLIGSLCVEIAHICAKHEVTFTVTGKGSNAVINLS